MGLNFHSANGHKNYHDNFNGILANESTFRYLIFRKKIQSGRRTTTNDTTIIFYEIIISILLITNLKKYFNHLPQLKYGNY